MKMPNYNFSEDIFTDEALQVVMDSKTEILAMLNDEQKVIAEKLFNEYETQQKMKQAMNEVEDNLNRAIALLIEYARFAYLDNPVEGKEQPKVINLLTLK